MGNPAFWELLQRLQVTPKDVDPKDMDGVHVDALACYFYYITTMDYYITRRVFREQKEDEIVDDLQVKRIDRLATALDNKMAQTFDKGTAILHIDGQATLQKKHAHEERSAVHGEKLICLNEKVTTVTELCHQSLQHSPPTSTTMRKVRKAYRSAQKQWKKTMRIDLATRVALAEALKRRGWQMCHNDDHTGTCIGEADVCVGIIASSRQRELGPLVVATTDSDLLVYNNVSVLRQHPRQKSSYSLYVQDEVLATLNENRPKLKRGKKTVKRVQVLTAEVWRVLAVVSGNDYDANVRGFGIRKNWAILAEIWSRTRLDSEADLLRAYRREMSTRRNKDGPLIVPEFINSASVFLHLREDIQDDAPALTTNDNIMKTMRLYGQAVGAHNLAKVEKNQVYRARVVSARPKGYVRHFRTSGNAYTPKVIAPPSRHPPAAAPVAPTTLSTQKSARIDKGKRKAETEAAKTESKKPKKKEKKPKVRVVRSARWMREKQDHADREADAQAAGTELARHRRKTNLGQLINQAVGSKYETITMNVGTIRACLQGALPKCLETASQDTLSALADDIGKTMANLAKLNSDLCIIASLALQHYIVTVMAEHPSVNQAQARTEAFKPLHKGQSFFPALIKELYRPTTSYHTRATSDSRAGVDAARMFLIAYEDELAAPLAEIQQHLNHNAPKGFLEFVARQLSDKFRSHVDHYLVILKRRVLQRAPGWSRGEGSALLQSVDDKTGKSPDHDPISLLWIMNAALTKDLRISLYPKPGWRDSFVTLSETYLFQALIRPRDNAEEDKLVKLYHVMFKQDAIAESSMDEDENGEVNIFANHRGHLTRQLFLSGRTNFARHGAVGNPRDRTLPSVLDFSTPTYQQAIGALAGASSSDKSYAQCKKDFKALVLQDLGSRYPRPPSQADTDRKYLLCGTFCTDGYQVKLHAYHLDRPKKEDPSPASSSSSSSASSSSAPSSSSASTPAVSSKAAGYRRKTRYIREALKSQDDVESVFGDQQSCIVGAIDPGIHKPATFMVQDTLDPQHRLVIDVPRGDLTFNERLFRSRLERAKKRDKIHEVEQRIKGFRLAEPPVSCSAQPLSAQPLPDHQTATTPEPTAAAASLVQEDSPDRLSTTFSEAPINFEWHARSVLATSVQLRKFYGSDEYKRWLYQKQQGTRAEFGKAIKSILTTLQEPTHGQHPFSNNRAAIKSRKPILGIGDGNFGKLWSGKDRSGRFRDKLVAEAVGRGLPTYQLDEFRTSATCCNCGSVNKTQGRTVVCQGEACGVMKDRDHNATNNMGQAMVMWVSDFTWPEHLERVTTIKVEEIDHVLA
ncbi:hypothetical protein BGZ72_002367 [Mortierella alpina]|nr:hypothetical protein BGZ72_002367 [Mortierella alpina]